MTTQEQLKEIAQDICDTFFEAGARISKGHYLYVLDKLSQATRGAFPPNNGVEQDVLESAILDKLSQATRGAFPPNADRTGDKGLIK